MASVNVYDRSTGNTYTINILMASDVLSDVHDGGLDHYAIFSTSERTVHNEPIPDRIVRVFPGDFTATAEAEIAEIIREIVEGFESSSSVVVGSSSQSSLNSSSSSLNSSSSTPSSLNSSSRSTSSASTRNSSSSSESSASSKSSSSSRSTSSWSSGLPVILPPGGSTILPPAGKYIVEYTGAPSTTADVVINAVTFQVANVAGQFVWDSNNAHSGLHTFTFIGESIVRMAGMFTFSVQWSGFASLVFKVDFNPPISSSSSASSVSSVSTPSSPTSESSSSSSSSVSSVSSPSSSSSSQSSVSSSSSSSQSSVSSSSSSQSSVSSSSSSQSSVSSSSSASSASSVSSSSSVSSVSSGSSVNSSSSSSSASSASSVSSSSSVSSVSSGSSVNSSASSPSSASSASSVSSVSSASSVMVGWSDAFTYTFAISDDGWSDFGDPTNVKFQSGIGNPAGSFGTSANNPPVDTFQSGSVQINIPNGQNYRIVFDYYSETPAGQNTTKNVGWFSDTPWAPVVTCDGVWHTYIGPTRTSGGDGGSHSLYIGPLYAGTGYGEVIDNVKVQYHA